jgi:hypothetical protein
LPDEPDEEEGAGDSADCDRTNDNKESEEADS